MTKVPVNNFDLSHDLKMSFKMGELVPTCCMEVIPGDVFKINVQNLLRFSALIAPVMHRVRVATHYFFVPNRLLWEGWDKWIAGDETIGNHPYFELLNTDSIDNGSLMDYLGYPTNQQPAAAVRMSPFPLAAYLKIYDEYFRQQDLQNERFTPLVPGSNQSFYDDWLGLDCLRRDWAHDYFTSCLPFAQKGAAVEIPLAGGPVPVEVDLNAASPQIVQPVTGNPLTGDLGSANVVDPADLSLLGTPNVNVLLDPNNSLNVDVQAQALDLNVLRYAFRLQEWMEKNARAGTRYIESILAHFGVRSSDSRLQRPEYLFSTNQNMVISEVLSTAQTGDNEDIQNPVGQMGGHAISFGGGGYHKFRSTEHGFLIGLISVIPDTAYFQGLHRSFTRFDQFDYAWPLFSNLGEQSVLEKELYIAGTQPDRIFGFIPRYSEYKFHNSRVAGEMKDTLAFWHLARKFDEPPVLNDEFLQCSAREDIFAVTGSADHVYAHIMLGIDCVRRLPRFGIPSI